MSILMQLVEEDFQKESSRRKIKRNQVERRQQVAANSRGNRQRTPPPEQPAPKVPDQPLVRRGDSSLTGGAKGATRAGNRQLLRRIAAGAGGAAALGAVGYGIHRATRKKDGDMKKAASALIGVEDLSGTLLFKLSAADFEKESRLGLGTAPTASPIIRDQEGRSRHGATTALHAGGLGSLAALGAGLLSRRAGANTKDLLIDAALAGTAGAGLGALTGTATHTADRLARGNVRRQG